MTEKNSEVSHLYIIGAGGHSKVVIDIVEKNNDFCIIEIIDDNQELQGLNFFDYPVLGNRAILQESDRTGSSFIVAIGDNTIRQKVSAELEECGAKLYTAIHPSTQISRNVEVGKGTVVMALCVINADTTIGKNVIVNSRASIDHDCVIEDGVHIAPGVTICGGVHIGAGAFIGAGTTIVPGIQIGERVVVGAGSVVLSSIPHEQVVAGAPATTIKRK